MVRPGKFEIEQTDEGRDVTLSLTGELDMRTVTELSERLARCLSDGARRVTVDLRRLAFMDSSGLRLLIELHDRSCEEGWTLRLVHPDDEAAALVLRVSGADKELPFVKADEA
jgi:anti-sigma B factor antagonist